MDRLDKKEMRKQNQTSHKNRTRPSGALDKENNEEIAKAENGEAGGLYNNDSSVFDGFSYRLVTDLGNSVAHTNSMIDPQGKAAG